MLEESKRFNFFFIRSQDEQKQTVINDLSKVLAEKLTEKNWSEDDMKRIVEDHDQYMENQLSALSDEKGRHMAALREKLAKRRMEKEASLRATHDEQVRRNSAF